MHNQSLDHTRVKAARKFRKITQVQLADITGISQANISFIEAGRHSASAEVIEGLCKALDVTEEWLLGNTKDGGVPIDEGSYNIKPDEKSKIGARFLESYERLRSLGVIESDAEFSEFAGINKGSLSLALAGKTPVNFEWIPFLEQKGANREYIYNNQLPVITLGKSRRVKDSDELAKNIQILVGNIEEDMKQLKYYLSQIM